MYIYLDLSWTFDTIIFINIYFIQNEKVAS